MKAFIKNSIIFFIIFTTILFTGLCLPNNSYPRSIDYSIITKHKLLEKYKKPKLILTGGSNVLFGFNSKILSDSLQIPVVNHAIHAGYGLKYILDDILPYINKGDVILLAPEYSHLFDNNFLGNEPLLFSLTAVPKNIKLISFDQFIHVSPFIPKFSFDRMKSFVYSLLIKRDKNSTSKDMYTEFAINEFGDNKMHWDLEKTKFEPYKFSGEFNFKLLELLKKFENEIKAKQATLYISYPSLCKSSFEINKDRIEIVKSELEANNFKILGTPLDFIYNDNYFFDSAYHLNGKGVIKRSEKTTALLKQKND